MSQQYPLLNSVTFDFFSHEHCPDTCWCRHGLLGNHRRDCDGLQTKVVLSCEGRECDRKDQEKAKLLLQQLCHKIVKNLTFFDVNLEKVRSVTFTDLRLN